MSNSIGSSLIKNVSTRALLQMVVLLASLAMRVTARLPTRADVWMICPRQGVTTLTATTTRTTTTTSTTAIGFHPISLPGQWHRQLQQLSITGTRAFPRSLVHRHFSPQNRPFHYSQTTASSVNAFLRRHQPKKNVPFTSTSSNYRRILVKRHLLDFFDPLEPIELVWELYVNRYEILDEMVSRLSQFTRRHSVRAGLYFVTALGTAEILARLGVLGKKKKSLMHVLRNSQRVNEGVEERLYQKTSSWMLNHAIHFFSKFRHLGNKSKFAIAVTAGGIFGQMAIQTTVLAVKTVLISFFVLETASFLGIIGEPGESLLDFVEDEYGKHAAWTTRLVHWHKTARGCMNLEVLEELYEACVDEEKIASFGFSVGTVFALLT